MAEDHAQVGALGALLDEGERRRRVGHLTITGDIHVHPAIAWALGSGSVGGGRRGLAGAGDTNMLEWALTVCSTRCASYDMWAVTTGNRE